MLVTELKISGYKTLRDVVLHPGRLNVVIGPNASGKSNLLRLLRLIRNSANGQLNDHIINDGGVGGILWNGTGRESHVVFQVAMVSPQLNPEYVVRYDLSLQQLGSQPAYVVHREILSSVYKGQDSQVFLKREGASGSVGYMSDPPGLPLTDFKIDKISSTESLLSVINASSYTAGPPPIVTHMSGDLSRWVVHDEFHSERNAEIRRPVVARHDEQIDSDGQNLASVLHTYYENDAEFHENIDRAMTAAFGDEYKSLAFPPAGSQNIELCVRWRSIKRPQPASTLSDGTLRFLFLITALSLPKPPPLIAIDEPETGLHPSMFPIVAEYAENASLKSQVILTTHSTQFLDAFRDKAPTVTVTKLVDGETKLATLDDEHLNYWLKDYTLGSLFRSGELENMGADIFEQEHAGDIDDENTVIAPASHQAE